MSNIIKNPGKTLVETIWGTNFFDSLPPKWKSSLKMKRYKTAVPNGTNPDAISSINLSDLMTEIVATSQVTTNRSNELEKMTEKIQVALLLTTTMSGQEYDEQFNLPIPYTEHLALNGAEIGDNRKIITPLNSVLSEVRVLDLTAFEIVLANYSLSFPSTTNVDIPDILTGITIAKETNQSNGTATTDVLSAVWSGNHSITLPVNESAQASAAVSCEVIPHMVPFYGVKRSVINYLFYLPSPVTSAQVTAKLEALTSLTVTNWADFKPGYITITIFGTRQSVRAGINVALHDSVGSDGTSQMYSSSSESSKEGGMTVKTVRIPPTLHGTITLKDEANSDIALTGTTNATATAHAIVLSGSIGFTVPETVVTAAATYRIVADGLTATSGPTALPTEGLLIVDDDGSPFKYGYVRILAKVIDASTLA